MRILILSQYFWPETFRITEVATTLRDEGCEVVVLTGQPNYPDGAIFSGYSAGALMKDAYAGIDIFRVPICPRGHRSAALLVLNYFSFIISAGVFGPWLLRDRPVDVILVYAPSPLLQAIPAIWLAYIKNAYLVTWVQDLWPESLSATGFIKSKLVLKVVERIVTWIYKKNDCLLVQSEAFIPPVKKMAQNTPVLYHPNPGDLPSLYEGHAISPINLKNDFNVVFTGNLGTVQAIDTVIKAATILRQEEDICFILVGSGSRVNWIKNEIARLELTNIQLVGRFPLSAMPAIMQQASALLVSLVRSPIMSQTVPSKIQAYFSAGKPIIASLDGEGARIIDISGAGISCPAEDPFALAEAVKSLRNMPSEIREQMSMNAINFYNYHFEPRMLANRLRNLLAAIKERRK